jgi:hypothetical protein
MLTLNTIAISISAEDAWNLEIVDQSGSAGSHVSLALNSAGVPLISYVDTSSNYLRWAYLSGTAWVRETKNDPSSGSTSVAFDPANNPYIAYCDKNYNVKIKYANPSFKNWRDKTVDTTDHQFAQVSLVVDANGNEHLSYWDVTDGDLKFAYRSGTVFVISTVDSLGIVGEFSSIDLGPGNSVHISYYDRSNGDLKLASSTDKINWAISTVDGTGDVGLYTSLAVGDDGRQHISYYDATNGDLKYAAKNAEGTWNLLAAASGGNEGAWTSLALDAAGQPLISFMDLDGQQLKFAQRVGGSLVTSVVDPAPGSGAYSSIAFSGSNDARIAYGDVQNGFTKTATRHFAEHAPIFTSVPPNGRETVPYEYAPTFNEEAVITAHATNAPFLSWNGAGYQGTPGLQDAGNYWISISARSVAGGLTAYQNSTFTITDTWAPTFTSSPPNGQETVPYEYAPTFNETVTITAHATNAPFLSWNGAGYQGTPGLQDAGNYWIDLTARSVAGLLSADQNSTFTIADTVVITWAPTFTSQPVTTGRELSPYRYEPKCNETVTWTVSSSAGFLIWDGTALTGTPGTNGAGSYAVSIKAVSVAGKLSAWQNYTLVIGDTWSPTFLTAPINQGRELSPYRYEPKCNETVTWTVSGYPGFLSWDGTALAGTPGLQDAGSYSIKIKALSVVGTLASWQNYTLVIADTWAPTFTSSPADGRPGTPYSYVPTFNESVTITAHLTNAPFLSWNGAGYQGTPGSQDAGNYWISITARSNAGLLTATQNATFVIGGAWAPTFTSFPGDGRETFPYSYVPKFNESATITAHLTNAPFLSWTGNGYSGTPGLGSAGQYWISVTAISVPGTGSATLNRTFTIYASWAPTFTSFPEDSRETVFYSYTPTFNESVTITAHSTTAPFLSWNGVGYQGTPSLAQSGSYWINITARSVNGGLSAELHSQFTVYDSLAPIITSAPVTEGRELSFYEYRPTCDEAVIWTVSGYPSFLSWDGSALSGTPGLDGSGRYPISIRALNTAGLAVWQNYTLLIADTWAPRFTNAPPDGRIGSPYAYVPAFNETAVITNYSTNAQFLHWKGDGYQGTPDIEDPGTYWINITALSVNGTLSGYQNRSFVVSQGWAPTFNNAPGNGMELFHYAYVPNFNESVIITAHSTDASFLIWIGQGYQGIPQLGQAGTYWMNITVISNIGRLYAWQNSTVIIEPLGPPVFLSDVPPGPYFYPLEFYYSIQTSQECSFSLSTNASFLSLQGNQVSGRMSPGTYQVSLQAISVLSGLTSWQNFTLLVGTDEEPPEIIVENVIDGAFMNSTVLDLDLSCLDGDGSGGVSIWSSVNQAAWRYHGQVKRISLEVPQGTSHVRIKGVDRVGNEGSLNFTVHVDTVAPAVLRHSHVGDRVLPEGALSVEFSKAMDRNTVRVMVNGALADLAWDNSTAHFTPAQGWDEDADYNVTVSGKDLYGNQLPVVSWTFRTGISTVLASGKVTDHFGNPVANATLSINGTVVAITDRNGSFSFEVRPGTYIVVVSGEGFEDLTIEIVAARSVPVELNTVMEWHRDIPWTIWLPLPFFLLQAVLIVIYRRRHP